MLELHNVRIEPSNVKKKVRELPNVRKELSRDVGTAQCEDGTIKFKEKSKGTTKCEKRIVTCDVGTAQCEDEIVKCEKKITWYSRLPTSGYRIPFFLRGDRRITHTYIYIYIYVI